MKKHLLTSSCDGGGITRLRNNAFTLIELLAIIVILAIIAVITVPIILNIIENSRKGAATDSAYGYKDSVNKTYIAELQNHNKLKLEGTYTVNSDGSLTPADENTDFNEDDYDSLDVQVSGTIPSSGELTYENNVLKSGYLVIGDYRVTFNSDGTITTVKNIGTSSNEQVASDPALVNFTLAEMCPNCEYTQSSVYLGSENSFTSDDVYEEPPEVFESFLGFIRNENGAVTRIFACKGMYIEESTVYYCIEGIDGSKYSRNKTILNHFYGSDCEIDANDTSIQCNGGNDTANVLGAVKIIAYDDIYVDTYGHLN